MAPAGTLIGLTGRAGAGKSTVAAHLEERHGFARIAFADPILAMIGALFEEAGVDGAWAVERGLKECAAPMLGVSYRTLAQTLGTEWGRKLIAQDLWIRVAEAKLRQLRLQDAPVVIEDVRFANEAWHVRQRGGLLVRVERPGLPDLPAGRSAHASEAGLDELPADATLVNAGSRETLHDQVDRLLDMQGHPSHHRSPAL